MAATSTHVAAAAPSGSSPAGAATPPPRPWLLGLEALRGIAALSVVFHHSWSLSTQPRFAGYEVVEGLGSWGVNLFFLLSGYLLADQFWGVVERRTFSTFYLRRLFRVAPAYYVNIGLLFLFFASHQLLWSRQGLEQLVANLTFTHYLRPETSSSLNVNGALWTLSIEALLYLFLPVMSLAVRRFRWWAVGGMIALGVGYRLVVALRGAGLRTWYFGEGSAVPEPIQNLYLARQFIGILPIFALGIGLRWAVLHSAAGRRWTTGTSRWSLTVMLALLVPSVLVLFQVERSSDYRHWVWFTGFDYLLAVLFIPPLLYAVRPLTRPPHLGVRLGAWMGERSYGLYIWHFPVVLSVYGRGPLLADPDVHPAGAKVAVILVVSITLAAISWVAIERPAQRLGRDLANRHRARGRPAAVPKEHRHDLG